MNAKINYFILFLAAFVSSCKDNKVPAAEATVQQLDTISVAEVKPTESDPKTEALRNAYPDFIQTIEGDSIYFTDGTSMVYDDLRAKDFQEMLDDSDPEDMFFIAYRSDSIPEYLADAGRSRSEALFKKMYGESEKKVAANLVSVPWNGKTVRFTSVNGAADSLRRVDTELRRHPELAKYLSCSGTFYWRKVRGAKRQSAHSFGIAIDIAVPNSDYWLWRNPGASETERIGYTNRIPREIIEIFEFRPEILRYAKSAN